MVGGIPYGANLPVNKMKDNPLAGGDDTPTQPGANPAVGSGAGVAGGGEYDPNDSFAACPAPSLQSHVGPPLPGRLEDHLVPFARPRRLRTTPALRALVRETRVRPEQLILPVFVADGLSEPRPIASLPGQYQHTIDSVRRLANDVAEAGLGGLMVFGVPRAEDKDEIGSPAWDPQGIGNRALAAIAAEVGDATVLMADTCLDEFTSHGHCGPLDENGRVVNDAALVCYQAAAVAQAAAGAQVIAPSGMMDGQVAAIRAALDRAGFKDRAIFAYSAKYASAFFGPFRDAVACGLSAGGDRKAYQQDPANRREGLREVILDLTEGADMVMVKPAGYYLDVLSDVAATAGVPVGAYQVSGEYAMVEAAAAQGWIDRRAVILEQLTSIARAGAGLILTYWALEAAAWL